MLYLGKVLRERPYLAFIIILMLFSFFYFHHTIRITAIPSVIGPYPGFDKSNFQYDFSELTPSLDFGNNRTANNASNLYGDRGHINNTFVGEQFYDESLTPGFADVLAQCKALASGGSQSWTNHESLLYRLKMLRTFIPSADQFLSEFKNPCWYDSYDFPANMQYMRYSGRKNIPLSNDLALLKHVGDAKSGPKSKLKCLPYFHLVGFPKGGTTALFYYIEKHPDYVSSCEKEPQWWGNYKIFGEKDRDVASVLYYIKCFDNTTQTFIRGDHSSLITGDGSTTTVWRQPPYTNHEGNRLPCETPLLINELQPKAKYIFLLREPIDQLYSAYWNFCLKRKDPNEFDKMVLFDFQSWKKCLEINSATYCLYKAYAKNDDNVCGIDGLMHNLYYMFVSIWMQVIPRDRILFLKSEDLKEDPAGVLRRVYKFLELSPVSHEKLLQIVNRRHINEQNFLHNAEDDDKFKMLASTRGLLTKFYKPFNQKLALLLGDDRFLWDDNYHKESRERKLR